MLRWLTRLVLFRLLGGRALAVLAVLGFVRGLLQRRRADRGTDLSSYRRADVSRRPPTAAPSETRPPPGPPGSDSPDRRP